MRHHILLVLAFGFATLAAGASVLAEPSATATAGQKEVLIPVAPRAAQIEPLAAGKPKKAVVLDRGNTANTRNKKR